MLNLIRKAMDNETQRQLFEAIVEIDETYVDGKPKKKNKHADNKKNKRGRRTSKTHVIGVKSRTTKGVYAKVTLPNKEGKKLSDKQLLAIFYDHENSHQIVKRKSKDSQNIFFRNKNISENYKI